MSQNTAMRITIGPFTFPQIVENGRPVRAFLTGEPLFAIPGGRIATETEIRRALAKHWDVVPATKYEEA